MIEIVQMYYLNDIELLSNEWSMDLNFGKFDIMSFSRNQVILNEYVMTYLVNDPVFRKIWEFGFKTTSYGTLKCVLLPQKAIE
ncbi:hypothetical protein BpHYR1_052392 [Brachionus plicatilis]|uniref:Uncharacterized protein n=1 Tax=Brachionus plicatilis TaxID=10195 RepID=A0A3M7SWL5_BRAPC|nr:hypothetical protein BpHYR1_052392 [Brachionus plicatilis]